MKLNKDGYNLIKQFEGCKLQAYQDSVGIWTIGYGSTYYENMQRVKQGDKVSQQRANEIFEFVANRFARNVDDLITSQPTQNQFNAVVSLAYNIGLGNFQRSTLLKKLNRNPNDKTIKYEFLKWINAGGRQLQGLINRRKKEAEIYFG